MLHPVPKIALPAMWRGCTRDVVQPTASRVTTDRTPAPRNYRAPMAATAMADPISRPPSIPSGRFTVARNAMMTSPISGPAMYQGQRASVMVLSSTIRSHDRPYFTARGEERSWARSTPARR
jgi:hypothetical protein